MKKILKSMMTILLAFSILIGSSPIQFLSESFIKAHALTPYGTPSSSYASSKFYTNLCNVRLTGDQRTDIVNVAWSQYGYYEGNNSNELGGNNSNGSGDYTEYGRVIGSNPNQWCAYFVSWCARQAGIPTSILKNSGRAGHGSSYFDLKYWAGGSQSSDGGDFMGNYYTPKPGDLFFTSNWSHVGLVSSVSGSTFTSIEGNSSRKVSSYTYNIADYYFGVPDYENNSVAALSAPTVSTSSTTYTGAQNVSINWSSVSGASYYWLDIWKDGEHVFSESVNSTSYQYYCEPGSYGVYVAACNSASTARSDCYNFTVNSDASLSFSPSTIYMNVGETEAIAVTLSGTLPSNCYSSYEYDSNYFSHTVNETTIYVKSLKPCIMAPFSLCIYDSKGNLIAKATAKITATKDKTLTYNANGGSGAPSSYSSTNLLVTTTISSTVPTRFGYKFIGWSTSSSATSATYVPGDSISFGDNLTLYAVWESATTANLGTIYNVNISFANQEYWYKFTPSSSGTYYFESAADGLDTRVYIYNSSQTQLAYDDDSGEEDNYYCTCNMTAGTTYYIKVRMYGSGTGSFAHGIGKVKYTLSYNANGGSGAPSSQTGSTTYTISSTKPTRSGYTFLGWSTSSSATSATYSAGGSITLTANTTLYAVWSKNPYTVTLYSGTDKATSKTVSTTGSLTFVTPASVSGWTTLGWRKDTTASTATYSSTGSTTVSGNSTFYAVYSKPLSVTFNANGGSGAPSSQRVTRYYNSYGNYSTASLTLSSTKPTRSGYTFLGWSTSSSATSATYSAGGSITLTADTTLYAVWSKNPYTVTLYSGIDKATSKTISTTGSLTFVTPASVSGWTTLGWRKDTTASTATYSSTGSTTVSGNSTFYAVYSKPLSVTFNANGGSGAPSSQSVTRYYNSYGTYSTASLTLSSTKPTRSGYTFLGWSTSSSATSATYSAGGSITLTANTTLYAVWSKNPYTVTLYSGIDKATSKTVSTTGSLTFVTPASVSGWTTLGWRKDTTASTATYSSTGSTTVSGNSTFYAVYSKPLSVTFNANGGSGAPSSQSVTRYYNSYGNYSTASLTLSSTKPTRSGYTFLGWSTSSSATSATYSAGGSITLTANATLYAVWSSNTYTLTYNPIGGTGAPSEQVGATSYTISSIVPTKFGYTFGGWLTNQSVIYKPGETIRLSSDSTIYAIWYTPEEISLNSDISTSIEFANQEIYYIFNPSSNGEYTFESSGSLDSKINLYNSSGTELGYDDNSSENGSNFMLTKSLTANNTYYIKVRAYGTNTGSTKFTVKKEAPITYTLSYGANGGSGAPSTQSGATSYTISSTVPTRSGYTFLGWSTSSSATSATYSAGGSITLTANTTLYAVWSKNPYTVTLYSGVDKATSKTISTTGSLTFVTPANVSDWTTLGWRKDTTASTATYSSTGSTTVSGNSTFYAVYSKPLSVTFNANGGSGAPSSQSVTRYYNSYGTYSTASLTLSSIKPTRSGYTFLGWSKSSSATSATYTCGDTVTLTENVTLYAVWNINPTTYTLSYNANGGSNAPSSQTGSTTYTISSTIPTRFGHTFLGWSKSSSATSSSYRPGDIINLSSNTTLYAVWKPADNISVGSSFNVPIATPGQVYLVKFTATVSDKYTIESTGSNDTYVYLYDANGYQLSFNDDGGDNRNFSLSYDLTAGQTYYYGIKFYDSSKTGTISVSINADNSSVAKGDVNGDGYVDATDASLIARYDAGYVTLSSTQLEVADVNKDGYVDATDASLIARYDAGYISEI